MLSYDSLGKFYAFIFMLGKKTVVDFSFYFRIKLLRPKLAII